MAIYLTGPLSNAGKLYSWIDENGLKQYSDHPPVGIIYTEKRINNGTGANSSAIPRGLRHGELDLLRKSSRRDAGIKSSRMAAFKQHKARSYDCAAAKEKYSNALDNSISKGIEHKEKAKKLYHQMRDECF